MTRSLLMRGVVLSALVAMVCSVGAPMAKADDAGERPLAALPAPEVDDLFTKELRMVDVRGFHPARETIVLANTAMDHHQMMLSKRTIQEDSVKGHNAQALTIQFRADGLISPAERVVGLRAGTVYKLDEDDYRDIGVRY
jgi:hypothetical protein